MKEMMIILILVMLTGCISNPGNTKSTEIDLNDTIIVGYGIIYGVDSYTQVSIHRDDNLKLYVANSSIKAVWIIDDKIVLY